MSIIEPDIITVDRARSERERRFKWRFRAAVDKFNELVTALPKPWKMTVDADILHPLSEKARAAGWNIATFSDNGITIDEP